MYKLIYDVDELKLFYENILLPLNKGEVYFVSLSARTKYLSEGDRKKLNLGRTEMFERRIIRYRNWDRLLRTLRKFEVNEGAYLTKNNSIIPANIITCYININPSNSLKAYKKYSQTMIDYLFELSICLGKGQDIENIYNRINKQDVLLMNCYQQSRGIKWWIDIDIDIPKKYYYILRGIRRDIKVDDILIETRSGYHLLLRKKYNFNKFNKEINPIIITKLLNYEIGKVCKENFEIHINKNEMIPVPGMMQAGFPVKIIGL